MFNFLLERLALELGRRDIPYMVIGGQAVLRYGEPRLTRDIDVVVGCGLESIGTMVDTAIACGLRVLTPSAAEFVRETMVLPCVHDESGIRVDFVLGESGFEQDATRRARPFRIGAAAVRFASPEDLLVMKTVAGRPRDMDDIRAIVLKNPALDLDSVRATLAQLEEVLARDLVRGFEGAITQGTEFADS